MLKKLRLQRDLKEKKLRLEKIEKIVNETEVKKQELEKAIDEAKTQEDVELIEKEIDGLEEAPQEELNNLTSEIEKIENDINSLDDEERKIKTNKNSEILYTERKTVIMANETKDALSYSKRSQIVERDDVKKFLAEVRSLGRSERGITNANLLIPDVMLELLHDNLNVYSKLRSRVNLKQIKGKGRQRVAGTIPEGIWTEVTGKLNEVSLTFNEIDIDGYKIGAFIPIANSALEDSDIDLFTEIYNNLGQGLGLGLDRAILFGTGTRMPVGIATRLAETSAPTNWEAYRSAWTDLHTSNLLKFSATEYAYEGSKWFSALISKLGIIKQNYAATTNRFWAMNTKTFNTIIAKAVAFDSSATVVSQVNLQMPVIGGDIVLLDFIADNDIFGGFGSLYLLGERKETQLAYSTEYKFVEDQTVFKGTARYDGQPLFGEGFVGINIGNNTAPTTTSTFPQDTVNP